MDSAGSKNLFTGDPAKIESLDIELPLVGAQGPSCDYYFTAYASAAVHADENGNHEQGALYRFLKEVTSFMASFDTPSQPFRPVAETADGRRTAIPNDLTPADIKVLQMIAPKTSDPILRARLFDVLWEMSQDKDKFKYGMDAAKAYIEAAVKSDTDEAARFGRDKELFQLGAKSDHCSSQKCGLKF